MIVVSNTSPLTNLAAIGQFELLKIYRRAINVNYQLIIKKFAIFGYLCSNVRWEQFGEM
jgi:predicted nucleic acid-binding protein